MLDKVRELAKLTYAIFRHAARRYGMDRVNRMAAAVAYRSIFAMAPLLILAVYVVGLVVGGNAQAQMEILDAINRVAGSQVESAVETILQQLANTGAATGVVGIVLLLWTSSSLFLELQNDLNDIFDVPYEQTTGILEVIRKRGLGFVWAIGLGLILLAVLFVNNIWQFLGDLFPENFEPVHRAIAVATPVVSVLVMPFVLALFLQTLTQAKVRWRAIWWGSAFTTAAILVATYGASLYFQTSTDTAAGLAGAIFVVVLLTYIFSSVFLFGAEVTMSYEWYLDNGHPPGVVESESRIPDALVEEPEPSLPLGVVLGFLVGMLVGWRRKS